MSDSKDKPLEDKYYTPIEIAKRWKCCGESVRKLIRLGKLRAKKLGGIRVSKKDLLQYERFAAL